jgi:hypothetical protein
LVAALAAVPATAQTSWERQVQDQLQVIANDLAPQGWRYAGNPFTGELGKGQEETLRVALRAGTPYALVALCNKAKSDGRTARPLLEVNPTVTGKYRVVVRMAHCGTGPCAYGVGVFMK